MNRNFPLLRGSGKLGHQHGSYHAGEGANVELVRRAPPGDELEDTVFVDNTGPLEGLSLRIWHSRCSGFSN